MQNATRRLAPAIRSNQKPLDFRKITKDDQAEIEAYTHGLLPYSDFNFVSLFCWGGINGNEWTRLDGGFAIRLVDYITRESTFSVLCASDPIREMHRLLDFAERSGVSAKLKYIPEPIAKMASETGQFAVIEDRDNHDYLFDFRQMADYSGARSKNKHKRAEAIAADRDFQFQVVSNASLSGPEVHAFLSRWASEKESLGKPVDLSDEFIGISRLLEVVNHLDGIRIFLLRRIGEIVAISIDEMLPDGHVVSHFCKALLTVRGSSEYLNREVARNLLGRGATMWNWEQDLGLRNLREMKTGYRPVGFLRKFIISRA